MYHGYITSEDIRRGYYYVDGIPRRVDGKRIVLGPGMLDLPPYPTREPGNPMTSGFFADMRPGMMGPGMKNYYTTENQASSTAE